MEMLSVTQGEATSLLIRGLFVALELGASCTAEVSQQCSSSCDQDARWWLPYVLLCDSFALSSSPSLTLCCQDLAFQDTSPQKEEK